MRLRLTLSVALLTLAFTGCKPDAALKRSETIGSGTPPARTPGPYEPHTPDGLVPQIPPPADPSKGGGATGPVGSVTGTVTFVGKAPARIPIDVSMDPACSLANDGKVLTEQYVVTNGKLANVFLYVKSGPAVAMNAGPLTNQPVVLDQHGCQYIPHVIGVFQGGSVEFRNSDPTMHNIHTMPTVVGNETIDVSQGPRGAPVTKQLSHPELMMPVRCNNHPWMNAFINVSPTPYFAVTGTDGTFSLRGLPPGVYTIGAVQEKMGERTQQVTVAADGTSKANFTFGQ